MRNLERELGVHLLDRHRSGAKVSEQGRELLPHIVNVLDAVRSTLERLSESLRAALEATVNPGIYGPAGRRIGHVPAARLDASA